MNSHTKQRATIHAAFDQLPDLQDGWHDVRERLLDMNIEQERRHRNGHSVPNFSAVCAAKMFVVKHLLDALAEPDKFTVDDILSIRTEVLYAQAYAKKFAPALAEWAAKWREPMQEVDYAFLMKDAA